MFLNKIRSPIVAILICINKKHEMFLNFSIWILLASTALINKKHEMFLNNKEKP